VKYINLIISLIVLAMATQFACCDGVVSNDYPYTMFSGTFITYQYDEHKDRHWFHYLDDDGFQRRYGIIANSAHPIKMEGRFPVSGDTIEFEKTTSQEYTLWNISRDAPYIECESDFDIEMLQIVTEGYYVDLMYYTGLYERYYSYINKNGYLTFQKIEGSTTYTIKTNGRFPAVGDYFLIAKTSDSEYSIRVLCSANTVEPKCKVCEKCEECEDCKECKPCDSTDESEDHGPPDRQTQ